MSTQVHRTLVALCFCATALAARAQDVRPTYPIGFPGEAVGAPVAEASVPATPQATPTAEPAAIGGATLVEPAPAVITPVANANVAPVAVPTITSAAPVFHSTLPPIANPVSRSGTVR